jgi:branched-chain amino acid transport system substrate-binding protein
VRTRWPALFLALFAGIGGFPAACGGGDDEGDERVVSGDTLTIYSSLPLQGARRADSQSVNKGAKLALRQRGVKVGEHSIEFKLLDDALPRTDGFDAGKTQQNARQAVQDDTTIAYIGEFDSEATAVSLPILNRAGILQVSPSNTSIGLTSNEPRGAVQPGEPDKHYPSGERTYGRVIPNDAVQAAALATLMEADGCTMVYIANDDEPYGRALAKAFEDSAPGSGLQIISNEAYDTEDGSYRSLGSEIEGSDADCFLGSAQAGGSAVRLFQDVAEAAPDVRLYGPHRLGTPGFYDPGEGGVSAQVGSRITLTDPTLPAREYPPRGREFFADYEAEYAEEPGAYAIYGFEAMNVILDALERAGSRRNELQAVIEAFYDTNSRRSALGTYDIDEDGDTTLALYGAYAIQRGRLAFEEKIKPER